MKNSSEFSERWVQGLISDDPSLLGLGDLDVRDVERVQPRAGRLDMLLWDVESSTRYEVEIQLGATDESHIIRTIEYWDMERKRFPQYEHVGVIVAENITSRFFNVISLFNGFIPIIAIQMNVIELPDGTVTVVFTKVLDRTILGVEDEDSGPATDGKYWEKKSSEEHLATTQKVLEIIREIDPTVELKYNKHYIGLSRSGIPSNYVIFIPRRSHCAMELRIEQNEEISEQIEELGVATNPYHASRYRILLDPNDVSKHRDAFKALLEKAKASYDG